MPSPAYTDEINTFLDARLSPRVGRVVSRPASRLHDAGEPSPEPSPTPEPSPSASPDPDILALVQVIQQEQTATRVAGSGTFIASCTIIMFLMALLLFIALQRRR